MSKLIIKIIEFYQTYISFDSGILSILTPGGACKYQISCSEYTKRAVAQYGIAKGIWMGMQRIWRCR